MWRDNQLLSGRHQRRGQGQRSVLGLTRKVWENLGNQSILIPRRQDTAVVIVNIRLWDRTWMTEQTSNAWRKSACRGVGRRWLGQGRKELGYDLIPVDTSRSFTLTQSFRFHSLKHCRLMLVYNRESRGCRPVCEGGRVQLKPWHTSWWGNWRGYYWC